MSLEELIKKIEGLPEDQRKQVEDYVQQISIVKSKKPFEFKWAGGLKDLRDKYTSVELQHKAWGDDLKSI